jgi:pimeloyl-ACP methyl ester carboxylesterase
MIPGLFDPAQTRALKIPVTDGIEIDVEITEGQGPTLLWLCGYYSDINGSKASYMKQQCEAWGFRLIRFNYRCIDGPEDTWTTSDKFRAQTISNHVADALAVLKQLADGPVIAIGSSMGGWVGLRLMQLVPDKIAAFVGVNAAPDFTKDYTDNLDPAEFPPKFAPMIADGCNNHVMDTPITYTGPVLLLQGQRDASVPWRTALDIAANITGDDVTIHLVKDAEHGLNRPQDLELLWQTVNTVREKVRGPVVVPTDD